MCIIAVGHHDNNATNKDPLPLRVRQQMIEDWIFDEKCKGGDGFNKTIDVTAIKDVPFSNKLWSDNLDKLVREHRALSVDPETNKVVMVGGRDSFLKHYEGSYLGFEIPEVPHVSGTELREQTHAPSTGAEREWYRKGMIAAHTEKRYGNIYPTVDGIVWRKLKDAPLEILLGRKHGELQWRMPGGHVNISDKSLETAVMREVHEECGMIEVGMPEYFMSKPLNDRRYRGTKDVVYTTVFKLQYIFGCAQAGDDLEEVKWFSIHEVRELDIVEDHQEILEAYAD